MELVLTVITAPPQTGLAGQSQILAGTGGSFGRATDNSWVLPDPERVVSSHHATISCQGGSYVLIDHSTNGTFINGAAQPLGQGNSVALRDGDLVDIGPFRLRADLRQPARAAPDLGGSVLDGLGAAPAAPAAAPVPPARAAAPPPAAAAPLDDLDRWLEPAATPPAPGSTWSTATPGDSGSSADWEPPQDTDPLALLGGASGRNPDDAWLQPGAAADDEAWWQQGSRADHAPAEQQAIRVPNPQPAPEAVDIDALLNLPPETSATAGDITARPATPPQGSGDTAVPAGAPPRAEPPQPSSPAPATAATPASAPEQPAALRQLADELGLQRLEEAALPGLARQLVDVVRATAERLIDILRARSSIKNELRLERTMISASENNPLKFSARVEDALACMFEDRGGAFLQGEDAIRDSFDDLADHQVAVLAGMRAAYEAMLAEFDPARLEQRLDGTGGAGLLGGRKARRWEAYEQHYARLLQDPESSYSRLFGETFARVYENQIAELKAARQLGRRS